MEDQQGSTKNIDELKADPKNPRIMDRHDAEALGQSMTKFGDLGCIVFNARTQQLVGGHQRIAMMQRLPQQKRVLITTRYEQPDENGTTALGYVYIGNKTFAYREVDWDEATQRAANIAANRIQGRFDLDLLAEVNYELSQLENGSDMLNLTGQTEDEVRKLLKSVGVGNSEDQEHGSLNDTFIVPPFSVLDTRQGYWQDRKHEWNERIGDLGESREKTLSGEGMLKDINNGVSILDPVLAELVVRWFGQPNGACFDPFAGDTVFGYVAAALGQQFTGIELRKEQVELNQKRVDQDSLPAKYICDDAANLEQHIADDSQDLIFSCPPYADLEHYSDLPNDLSNMSHDDFFKVYTLVLSRLYAKLKNNRFAVITVSEVRKKDGSYLGLVPKTIEVMQNAGFGFYNELVLVNAIGTLPQRVANSMKSRKVGRTHQNILVFYKGDPTKIKSEFAVLAEVEDWLKSEPPEENASPNP